MVDKETILRNIRDHEQSLVLETPAFSAFRDQLTTAVQKEELETFAARVGIKCFVVEAFLSGKFHWIKENKPDWNTNNGDKEGNPYHPRNVIIRNWAWAAARIADALDLSPELVCSAIDLELTGQVREAIRKTC